MVPDNEYKKLVDYQKQMIQFQSAIELAIEHCPELVYAAGWSVQLQQMENRAHHEIGWSADKLGKLDDE